MIKVGIVGPSRRHNGIGAFVARFLHDEGAAIVAVCGSTEESALRAAAEFKSVFGYRVDGFGTMGKMISSCDLDAIAICSPAPFHEDQLELTATAGLHAFCEKPLIWTEGSRLPDRVAALTKAFHTNGLVLHQDTQWIFVLEDLRGLLADQAIQQTRSFEMFMAPAEPGLSMLWETLPHPISLLVALGAVGVISDVHVDFAEDLGGLNIDFHAYRHSADFLNVRIILRAQATQPRPCYIALDGIRIDRQVVSLSPYRLALRRQDSIFRIQDPVQRSVRKFLDLINNRDYPSNSEIVRQFEIIAALRPFVLRAIDNYIDS